MQNFNTKKLTSLSIMFIILSILLVACGGGEASSTPTPEPPEPTDAPPALPSVTPQTEPTEAPPTTAPVEPTATATVDNGDSYPVATAPSAPTDEAYPAEPPTVAPPVNPYPEAEGATEMNVSFRVTSFGPIGNDQELIEGTEITLSITNTEISGYGGCNNFSSELTLADNTFQVGPIVITEMACMEPEGVFEQEQAFVTALQGADGYTWIGTDGSQAGEESIFYTLEDGTAGIINLSVVTE